MTKHNQLKRSNVTQRVRDLLTSIHSILGHFFQELAVGQSVLAAAIYSLLRSTQENSCVLKLRAVWNRFEREGGSLLENLRRRVTALKALKQRSLHLVAIFVSVIYLKCLHRRDIPSQQLANGDRSPRSRDDERRSVDRGPWWWLGYHAASHGKAVAAK
jgi:hypothetical protein